MYAILRPTNSVELADRQNKDKNIVFYYCTVNSPQHPKNMLDDHDDDCKYLEWIYA